jgi:hypothetical protein
MSFFKIVSYTFYIKIEERLVTTTTTAMLE